MRRFWLLLAGLVTLASAAGADRLVLLHDGTEIETRGPWRVEGKLVIFTSAAGKLSSLRATEVDLEASMTATERAAAPAEEPPAAAPAAAPPPVLVLTDRDVVRARPAPAAGGETPAVTASETAATAGAEAGADPDGGDAAGDDATTTDAAAGGRRPVISPAENLHVATWQSIENSAIGGIELVGQVINRADAVAIDVTLWVTITDTDGQPRRFDAFLGEPTIPPGRQTRFRIPLPGVFGLADDPVFELRGHAIRPRIAPAPDDDADGGGDEPSS